MSWLSDVRLVAGREISERLRSKVFWIGNAFLVGIFIVSIALPPLLFGEDTFALGVVGGDAEGTAALALELQDELGGELETTVLPDREAAEAAVGEDEIDGALVDGELLVDSAVPPPVRTTLETAHREIAVSRSLEEAGVSPEEQAELFAGATLTIEDVGDEEPADAAGPEAVVAYFASLLLFVLLLLYGQWVAQGIVEEKQSRVVELLVAAVRPSRLLAGKVAGVGLIGLAQVAVLVAIAIIGLFVTDVVELPARAWGALALVVPWYVLGYAMYALVFAMSGVLVARVEDLQSAVMPPFVLLFVALFSTQVALTAPGSVGAQVVALVPLTSPMVQPLRIASGTAPLWEPVLAAVLVLAVIALLVPLAARLYQGGLLATRTKLSVRRAWSSARR